VIGSRHTAHNPHGCRRSFARALFNIGISSLFGSKLVAPRLPHLCASHPERPSPLLAARGMSVGVNLRECRRRGGGGGG
jgi:hypothetical protein